VLPAVTPNDQTYKIRTKVNLQLSLKKDSFFSENTNVTNNTETPEHEQETQEPQEPHQE